MSLNTSYLSSAVPSERLGFGVKTPSPLLHADRAPPATVQKIVKSPYPAGVAAGSLNRAVPNIPATSLLGTTLFVAPGTSTDTFVLPTASQILSAFGRSTNTGVSSISTGDCLRYSVVNRSVTAGVLYSGQSGIDSATGSVAISTGGASGATGKATDFFLEFTNVGSSLAGVTGSYMIYPA